MTIPFTRSAFQDYLHWQRHDPRKAQRIEKLCKEIVARPFEGMGKPEPLKFDLHGCWSRRIDRIHRLVYRLSGRRVIVLSCRYHY